MRRKVTNRNIPKPDLEYGSEKLEKFINSVMWDGKKVTARRVVYRALDIVKKESGNENPLEVFETALKNAAPTVEVRSRRIGGANYQVPREVRPERRQALAFRWIISAARGKKGEPMEKKLATELLAAAKGEGSAVKKKEDTHRMAEANKAFAHFAW
ncbi:MAG: 30S ribosomal protein S7 [Candidatus Pacebacteria bacterium]|jgi:small subunit ribosomal protein S7|nr:30S ribosomal protein S7 [Candidatus Paceibacterota bacterium]MBP9058545.1 30S ribosomal protein S7 [Candidatus Paceibacterota bacterium]MBP9770525.1 30S ribosomal protein S7 [Candidatus Paceibacterota bacterium]